MYITYVYMYICINVYHISYLRDELQYFCTPTHFKLRDRFHVLLVYEGFTLFLTKEVVSPMEGKNGIVSPSQYEKTNETLQN